VTVINQYSRSGFCRSSGCLRRPGRNRPRRAIVVLQRRPFGLRQPEAALIDRGADFFLYLLRVQLWTAEVVKSAALFGGSDHETTQGWPQANRNIAKNLLVMYRD